MRRVIRGLRAARSRLRGQGARGTSRKVATNPAVAVLLASPLFDETWYSLVAERNFGRRAAAIEHYLSTGRPRGLSPHPLFVPDLVAAALADELGPGADAEESEAADPFLQYVRDRRFDLEVHPFFEAGRYLTANPEAIEHPAGPLGHYRDTGAARGAAVNSWYAPDPAEDPRGVEELIWREAAAWLVRREIGRPTWSGPNLRPIPGADARPVQDPAIGLTSIVLVVENPELDLAGSVRSVLAQTTTSWELIVVPVRLPVTGLSEISDDSRIRLEPVAPTLFAGYNRGLAASAGTHVVWMSVGDTWQPGRLSSLHRALLGSGSSWAHDYLTAERISRPPLRASRVLSRERMLAGARVELGSIIVATDAARAAGGFDESLLAGQPLEFVLRLGEEPGVAPYWGASVDRVTGRWWRPSPHLRPWVNFDRIASAGDVVLNTHLVDWDALAARDVAPDLVSILIPTYEDWVMTELAVRRVMEASAARVEAGVEVEVIVIDNGCGVVPATILSALPRQYPGVRLVQAVVNHGFALGNNLGLNLAGGGTVVFLNNDTEVEPGWLEPLVDALRDPEVLGAQSLLVYPDGTIQSAGVTFPRGGGLPHVLLQGFPTEDATGMGSDRLHALTGASLAMRFEDVVALRGFDPIYRNGMEDVDICLRMNELRPGHFVVLPDSRVIHHESKTPGRFTKSVVNRRVLMDRWAGRLPEDDVEAWGRRGYDVIGHSFVSAGIPDRRLRVAEPILAKRARIEIVEGTPSLRWAIKNPAPSGPKGEFWGDTHFARQLAGALRDLGQNVVVDHRGAFDRESESYDDVALLLRGLAPYTPLLDRVNLFWLISHPDMMERFEHIGWDRIYVASIPFAARIATEWGAPAVPLLQATDPAVFYPGLAEPDTGDRVLFIGNSRQQARPMVMAAAAQQLPLSVYGADWEDLIDPSFIRGRFVPNDQVGAAYRSAGIVLNDHWTDMVENGFMSNRLFDAVAAGARVVTDNVPGIRDVFGDAVQVVDDPADLGAIASASDLDAIFGTDEVRRARAAKVAAEHSFATRARTLLEDALRIRSERGYR